MISTRIRPIILAVIVTSMLLAGCGGKSEPTAPPATEAPQPTQAVQPTKAPEPTATTEAGQPAPTKAPAEPTETPESEIPYDVPIMDEATELDIQTGTGTVTYKLEDTMIEDVVEYYKTVMPEQGWEMVTASEVGLMATLVFQTEQARVSVSLQANNIAKTVNVRLFIISK